MGRLGTKIWGIWDLLWAKEFLILTESCLHSSYYAKNHAATIRTISQEIKEKYGENKVA